MLSVEQAPRRIPVQHAPADHPLQVDMLVFTVCYITIGATMALIAAAMGGRVSVAELVMVALLGPLALVAVLAIAGASVRSVRG